MTKKDQNFYTVLNCRVDSTPKDELLKLMRKRLTISKPLFVITPNAENVLGVSKDTNLQKLLNIVDYAPADSIGLVAAVYFLQLPVSTRRVTRLFQIVIQAFQTCILLVLRPQCITKTIPLIKGRVLFEDLITMANEQKWRVFLLGGQSNEAYLTKKKLSTLYPNLQIQSSAGPILDDQANPVSKHDESIQKEVLKDIRKFKPQLLFVAFNFPKQERWLAHHIKDLPVGLGMTVGGTFNYISGKSKLPPEWVSKQGLEWLWRLVNEPWRAGRVARAIFVFPLSVLKMKLSS